MKSVLLFEVIVAASLLACCARESAAPPIDVQRGERAVVGKDVGITTFDEPTEHRFYLKISSLSDRSICFDQTDWSDPQGRVVFARSMVSFVDGSGEVHPMALLGDGPASPHGISRLAPHATVDAFFSYDDFSPEVLAVPGPRGPLVLVEPYFCERSDAR